MARDLSMNGRKKIERIQKEFTDKFNYLTLIFLDDDMKSIDVSRSLAEVRTAKGPDISIMASLKVNTLEQRFKDSFGITVEVAYSKDGKVMHTKDSVNKTLNELNLWCEKNGCDMFLFKKALSRNTLLSTQEQLFNAIREVYPDAKAKKINKDNFMDIHIPSIHPKRGTHLFFNTAKNEIKLGFYVRDEDFISRVMESSSTIEQYSQGLRISGNPTFPNMDEAIEAAMGFIGEMVGIASNTSASKVIKEFVREFNENPDPICDLLDSMDSVAGKMSVYNVDLEILSSLDSGYVPDADNLEFLGEVNINDWDGLAKIIGVEEAEANRKEYENDSLHENSKIVFLYCDGEYVYSFLNPGDGKDEKSLDDDKLSKLNTISIKKISTSKKSSSSDSIFKTVKIGKQEWQAENLNVDKFRNGDLIPEVKSQKDWQKAGKSGKPAWCYYENKNINGEKYGKLYNWFAVNDPRGLAPEGWHIPSDEEWEQLTAYLGGEDEAGKKMKSNSGWEDYLDEDEYEDKDKGNGTNESGFSGLPGGNRISFPNFNGIGRFGCWWSSTEDTTDIAWDRDLDYENGSLNRDNFSKEFGLSVRCIKD